MAASLAVHGVLLALVAVQAPRLKIPSEPPGLPEAIIPVLIIPRTPPPPAAAPGTKPAPIRLHRRPQPFAEQTPPVAPLVAPVQESAPPARATVSPGPRLILGPTADDTLARNARNALRSRRDCDNPALTRAERDACTDRFAARYSDTPFQGLGVERGKAADLAAAVRRRQDDYAYKRSPGGGPGVSGTGYNAGQQMRPGAPNMGMGASAEDMARGAGCDEHCVAKAPF